MRVTDGKTFTTAIWMKAAGGMIQSRDATPHQKVTPRMISNLIITNTIPEATKHVNKWVWTLHNLYFISFSQKPWLDVM